MLKAQGADDSDNTAEFNVLCRIVRQCQSGFAEPEPTPPAEVSTLLTSIEKAFFLATATQAEFESNLTSNRLGLTKTDRMLPRSSGYKTLIEQMNNTLFYAKSFAEDATSAAKTASEEAKEANKKLNKALAGTEKKLSTDDDSPVYFEDTNLKDTYGDSASNTKNCRGAGTATYSTATNTGTTLISDIMCLCIAGPDDGKKPCAGGVTTQAEGATIATASASTAKASWTALMKICPKDTGHATTTKLTADLATFRHSIGRQARRATSNQEHARYFLGYAANGNSGCTAANSQICVNYKPLLTGDSPNKIPWLSEIESAIKKWRWHQARKLRSQLSKG
uniref:Variant surface glycoprotein 1125.2775 n=1 Tax=Trypanosoma brucei TaxID=5691 RepID=A0A1J0R8I3_9TRYP|nr:variant surface glycoprotein 1125.2775 [Trypanosoma brucei]